MEALPRRWLAFNSVGALGFVVQIATLAVLVNGLAVHYLVATVVAVEAALLHNFFWHRRWTWSDRPAAGSLTALRQLARFHLLNGLVSIAGNLLMMLALTGGLGWNPVVANLVTVLACSAVNFHASDRLVFRTAVVTLAAILLASNAAPIKASEADAPRLGPATLSAWQKYERLVEERYSRHAATGLFFAHDAFRQAPHWRRSVVAGDVQMFQTTVPDPELAEPVIPDGRVHHWVGAVFIPGATLDAVLRHLVEHAGREADAYEDVVASRLIDRRGERLRVFMKLRRESVITVVYNTEHEVEYRRVHSTRASSRSVATKIAELTDAGGPKEREKAAGQDHGFLWRLNAYWRYEQVPGGVLIECESVSLSRSVPMLLRPLVNRTVDRIARESLEKTMRSLRATLVGRMG